MNQRLRPEGILVISLLLVAVLRAGVRADSIETQSNPVTDGAITIEAGNPDRGDWSSIPWFPTDSDDMGFGVDAYRVQLAHDSSNVYLHIEMMEFEVAANDLWRIQLWVDADLDPDTGFLANWAIGPDYLLEVDTMYEYAGSAPGEWAWSSVVGGLQRDQSDPLDVVVEFPREAIGDPEAFDFFIMGQNFPDNSPDDALPDTANEVFGDFFTYDLTAAARPLQAGDANQDFKFDQIDLVQVQIAAKYLSNQPATWGEGDWDGAPGGTAGSPPAGDGRFDQLDIIAALAADKYLTGPYAALNSGGLEPVSASSVVYNAATGEVSVVAPNDRRLTSISIESAAEIFTGDDPPQLDGSFDNSSSATLFKATFGSSFGSLSFGSVAQAGLSKEFIANDLSVRGSLEGGGGLGQVELIYVPEPSAFLLTVAAVIGLLVRRRV